MPQNASDTDDTTDESLSSYLARHQIGPARIEQAARFLVAQLADFKTPSEMFQDLAESGVNPADLERIQAKLTQDETLLNLAALDVVAAGWHNPEQRSLTQGAIDESGARLPVVEVVSIVAAVMYGMWLLTTRGQRRTSRTVRHEADGTYVEVETTEWYDPTGPLRAVVDVLRLGDPRSIGTDPGNQLEANTDPPPPELPAREQDSNSE